MAVLSVIINYVCRLYDISVLQYKQVERDHFDIGHGVLTKLTNGLWPTNGSECKKNKAMTFHMPQKKIHKPLLQIAETDIEYVYNFILFFRHIYCPGQQFCIL